MEYGGWPEGWEGTTGCQRLPRPGLEGRLRWRLWECESSLVSLPNISPGALKKWRVSSLDTKTAFPQTDGFVREVFHRASFVWDPDGATRNWKLRALAQGWKGAPAASHHALHKISLNSAEWLAKVGLRRPESTSDLRLYFIFRKRGGALRAIAPHFDDISGRGEPFMRFPGRGPFWYVALGLRRSK